jgi:hypothetical protein
MQALWKNVRQSATIAVAKVTISDKDEDPIYLSKCDVLRKLNSDSATLLRNLTDWANSLVAQSTASVALSTAFSEAFSDADQPYSQRAVRSREGLIRLDRSCANLKATHVSHFCLKKLAEFQERIRSVAGLKTSRKDSRILMLQEEKKLRDVQEKGSPQLQHRQERFDAQKIEYERCHTQFVEGVAELERIKVEVFGRVFHCYQFYLTELVELQQQDIVEQNPDFPYAELKQELPSAQISIETQPADVTVRIDLSDDQHG